MAAEEEEKLTGAEPAREKKVRRSPRRLIKGILFLMICGGLMAIVVYSPLFTLQRVVLTGSNYLNQQDIMTAGHIYQGTPLFQLQTDVITQNLMHDLRIESAVVRRRLPDTATRPPRPAPASRPRRRNGSRAGPANPGPSG